MKNFLNVLIKIVGVFTLLVLVIVVFAISSNSQRIPDINIYNPSTSIEALRGNYTWNAFSEVLSKNDHVDSDYDYKNENTIITSPNDKLSISNPQSAGSRHVFSSSKFYYLDNYGQTQYATATDVSNTYNNSTTLEFYTPELEGTYLYFIDLDYFEKGRVEYSFKVIVSVDPTYDIQTLVKYKGTSIDDATSIREILNILPYFNNIKNVTIMDNEDVALHIYQDEVVLNRNSYINNAIALFTLIPAIDTIKIYSNDNYYIFTREELETLQGHEFSEYVNNPELWQLETFYKDRKYDESNTKYDALMQIIYDCTDMYSGEKIDALTIDTQSFLDYSGLELKKIDTNNVLSILKEQVNTLYDVSMSKHLSMRYKHMYIGSENITDDEEDSGDSLLTFDSYDSRALISGDIDSDFYTIPVVIIKDGMVQHYLYNAGYVNGSWIVSRHKT